MNHILIPFGGACLALYLGGYLMMLFAFVLDKMNAKKYGKPATWLFCTGFLIMTVASLFTIVAFFVFFSNGGI